MKLSVSKEFIISTQPIGCITLLTVEAQHCHRDCQPCLPEVIPGKISELMHIPADHEHRFRFNVNTISGPM
ncbi:hypothetical protein [Aeromonas veronii]|uniref:hypothetical protein n=1 Tax=Aeromonas veronii TaxID=654 RepID=UPI003BA0A306